MKLKIQVQTVFYTSEISNFKSIFFGGILIAIIEASQPQWDVYKPWACISISSFSLSDRPKNVLTPCNELID